MKLLLAITLAILLSGCFNREDEDFTPFPGGKSNKEQPKVSI